MRSDTELLEQARAAALEAGEILLGYYGRLGRADADRKGGRVRDLVSRADVEAERAIRARVPEGDGILAEEGAGRTGRSGLQWIVDPLDGTVNFLHGLPLWAVSIAIRRRGAAVAGIIHVPVLGWTFAARRGGGVRLGDAPVAVSATFRIEEAILATGFPYDRNRLADDNLDNVPRVGRMAAGLRRMGSAAIDLALVAAGRLDGFWELHLEPWDVAAGILMVQEAGGRVSDFRGACDEERLLHGRNLVATNGRIHEPLRAALAPLRGL